MNQIDIHNAIDTNNKIIKEALTPNIFLLNNTVRDAMKENEELQKKCGEIGHKFEAGYCIFCYKMDPIIQVEEEHE